MEHVRCTSDFRFANILFAFNFNAIESIPHTVYCTDDNAHRGVIYIWDGIECNMLEIQRKKMKWFIITPYQIEMNERF